MRKLLIFLLLLAPVAGFAQSSSGLPPPSSSPPYTVWTPAQWTAFFAHEASKVDGTNGVANNLTVNSGTASGMSVTATDGTTARTLAARAADVVNVMDFTGADPTDTNDSSTAINAAFAAARLLVIGTNIQTKIVFPQGTYKITSGLNWTGLAALGVEVDMQGATIDCQVAGGVCVDMLGDRFLVVRNLRITGNGATPPAIGVQYGRAVNAVSADQIVFENPLLYGSFSKADMINESSEDTTIIHMQAWNAAGAGSFTLIADGINHFSIASAFVTVTLPANTGQSFNDFHCIDCMLQATGGGNPLWVSGASNIDFDHGYMALTNPTSGSAYAVYAYSLGTGVAWWHAKFDVHFETGAITDTFFFTGTNATPVMDGFTYNELDSFSTNSLLKADTGITAVTLRNSDIRVAFYAGAAKLVDTTAHAALIWTFDGLYASPLLTQFNAQNWSGPVSIGSVEAQVNLSSCTSASSPVATGVGAMILGGCGNTASGTNSVAGGSASFATQNGDVALGYGSTLGGALSSAPGGANGFDQNVQGALIWSTGEIAAIGDAQMSFFVERGQTTSTSTVRLTSTNTSASASNCANLGNNGVADISVDVVAIDHTTIANNESWHGWSALFTRGANAGTAAIKTNTEPTPLTNGTVTGSGIALTADTSNGCPSVVFTPPSGNSDTWNVVAKVSVVSVY